jgi:hypothetical protein
MPDVSSLSAENRKALLGCVKAKNKKWKKDNGKDKVPNDVAQKHFRECSKALGYE